MRTVLYSVAILLLAGPAIRADKQTTEAGQQLMTARRTTKPVVIDGVFGSREWSAAIPVHVSAIKPDMAPGLVPWQGLPFVLNPPDNQDDSSFTIRAMYDDTYLYVAVDVADDIIETGNPVHLWLDDVAEIFIDGDTKSPEDWGVTAFQLVTSAIGQTALYPDPVMGIDWTSAAGMRPRGYLVETRVNLDSIVMADGGAPGLGSKIGFNVAVGDNDTGLIGDPWFWGDPFFDDGYFHIPNPDVAGNPLFDENNWFKNTPSSYVAWDGNSPDWFNGDASTWGTLYFVP